MIVVAIVAVLAAIAVPQYQDYIIRSRWSSNFQPIASLKQAISECLQNNNGAASSCDTESKLANQGFVGPTYTLPTPPFAAGPVTLVLNSAAIVIAGTNAAGNCTVSLTPSAAVGTSTVEWLFSNSGGCNRTKTGVGT